MVEVGIMTTSNRKHLFQQTIDFLGVEPDIVAKDISPVSRAFIFVLKRFMEGGRDYLLLMNDDIIVANDFMKAANFLVEKKKPEILSFYFARSVFKGKEGLFELNGRYFLSSACLLLRKDFVKDLLEFISNFDFLKYIKPQFVVNDDDILRAFLIDRKKKILIVSPSFAQHIGVNSTMKHPWNIGRRPRQSQFFIGKENNAFEKIKELIK